VEFEASKAVLTKALLLVRARSGSKFRFPEKKLEHLFFSWATKKLPKLSSFIVGLPSHSRANGYFCARYDFDPKTQLPSFAAQVLDSET
jgi:hypothetical protein